MLENMEYISRVQRTSEISCSTREINFIFPSIHALFSLLYKTIVLLFHKHRVGMCLIRIDTCEIIMNRHTREIIDFIIIIIIIIINNNLIII